MNGCESHFAFRVANSGEFFLGISRYVAFSQLVG
jgi:hypothetical protein